MYGASSVSNNFPIWIVLVLIFWVLCGIACALIANSKGRSVAGYFFIGLLLGIFGLILVAVAAPAESLVGPTRTPVEFLNNNDLSLPKLERGSLSIKATEFRFTPRGEKESWEIRIPDITDIKILDKTSLPDDFPLRSQILGGGKRVLLIDTQKSGAYYFRGNSGSLSNWVKRRLEPARTAAEAIKKCPFCAETIKAEAIKCKHCGADLVEAPTEETVGDKKHVISEPESGVFEVGAKCVAKSDIEIDGKTAFYKGNYITVEKIAPEAERPEYRYFVHSDLLNRDVCLSDMELAPYIKPMDRSARKRTRQPTEVFEESQAAQQMTSSSKIEAEATTKECPYCAETIKAKAIKCKHCGSDLSEE